MKKILFILCLSYFLFGCFENIHITSKEEKKSIAERWIINEFESFKELANGKIKYLEEKKESDNPKIRVKAQKELEEWNLIIDETRKEKEELERKKQERKERLEMERLEKEKKLEKERIDKFFNEFCYLLIKDDLREPESYRLDYVHYHKSGNKYYISHSFRAKNGFGGYNKELKKYEFNFTDDELKSDVRNIVIQKKIELLEQLIKERN